MRWIGLISPDYLCQATGESPEASRELGSCNWCSDQAQALMDVHPEWKVPATPLHTPHSPLPFSVPSTDCKLKISGSVWETGIRTRGREEGSCTALGMITHPTGEKRAQNVNTGGQIRSWRDTYASRVETQRYHVLPSIHHLHHPTHQLRGDYSLWGGGQRGREISSIPDQGPRVPPMPERSDQ